MDLEQAKQKVGYILEAIFESGDQDECSIKHIGYGTSLLWCGEDPSVQENYIDYSTAGISCAFSDWEEDVVIESGFQRIAWKTIYDLYKEFGIDVVKEPAEALTYYAFNYVEDYLKLGGKLD